MSAPEGEMPQPPQAVVVAQPAMERHDLSVLALPIYGLLFIGAVYALYFAATFMVPVFAAVLLNIIFSPLSRNLAKRRVPPPVSAFLLVLLLSGGLVSLSILLSEPIQDWLDRLPYLAWEIKGKLQEVMRPVEGVAQVTREVDELAKAAGVGAEGASEVTIKGPKFSSQLFESLQTLVLQLAIISALLFFLLASGDLFKERLVAMVSGLRGKKQVLVIMKKIEQDAAGYILTVSIINFLLGASVGLALWALGLPNAALWGVMAGLLNFIPFVGAIVGAAVVFMVALITLETIAAAAIAPLLYLGINILEAQFLTPAILGRKLTINPVAIFLFVLFWGWLWGVPGALMAVPILVVMRALCDNIEKFNVVALFLNGDISPSLHRWRASTVKTPR